MITFIDQDGDTVRLTQEEVAYCIRMMGNPRGYYALVPNTEAMTHVIGDVVLGIRWEKPRYSALRLWWKKVRGSKLVARDIPATFMGKRGVVKQDAKEVWLRLKRNEAHCIHVE